MVMQMDEPDWYASLTSYASRRPQMSGRGLEWIPIGGVAVELCLQGDMKGYRTKCAKIPEARPHPDLEAVDLINDSPEKGVPPEELENGAPVSFLYRDALDFFQEDGRPPGTATVQYNGQEFIAPDLEYLVITKLCSSLGGRRKDLDDVRKITAKYVLDGEKLRGYFSGSPAHALVKRRLEESADIGILHEHLSKSIHVSFESFKKAIEGFE